jgi:acetylxylan esterase
MVKYVIKNYGGDANRAFAIGFSSSAMMTNVVAGAYPDVFKAGSVYSGVLDGCFYVAGATAGMATPGWANQCANSQLTKTVQAWGDLVRGDHPGYSGTYTRTQI